MAILYYVPMIHEKDDFGLMKEAYERQLALLRGERGAMLFHRSVQQYWEKVKEEIRTIPFDYPNLQIYWDSLIIGLEEAILNYSLQESKTTDVLLVHSLVKKGAQLVGTEDRELVKKQISLIKGILQEPNAVTKQRLWREGLEENQALSRERDKFIIKRINETLKKQGIIFLGAFHQIEMGLARDIEIRRIPSGIEIKTSPDHTKVEILWKDSGKGDTRKQEEAQ